MIQIEKKWLAYDLNYQGVFNRSRTGCENCIGSGVCPTCNAIVVLATVGVLAIGEKVLISGDGWVGGDARVYDCRPIANGMRIIMLNTSMARP